MRGEMQARGSGRTWGRRRKIGMCTGRARRRAHAERTTNMSYMLLTLDVSKFSGWLNADAYANMSYMSVTPDVSKLIGWLIANAK